MHSVRSDRHIGPRRRIAAVGAASVLAIVLSGCAVSPDDWSAPRAAHATPSGTLPPGFLAPGATPSPAATITPADGSWDEVRPPAGYRVVLLLPTFDETTADLAAGVRAWAEDVDASLKTVQVESAHDEIDGIVAAMQLEPDLIVAPGPVLVDAMALVTASHLDQQFLMLGSQLPEPTFNVTAAVWAGGRSRGSEVANTAGSDDPVTYTAENANAAVQAGVASILNDLTGIVIDIGER